MSLFIVPRLYYIHSPPAGADHVRLRHLVATVAGQEHRGNA